MLQVKYLLRQALYGLVFFSFLKIHLQPCFFSELLDY